MGCHSQNSRKGKWSCIPNCGACCRLRPEERQEALEVLSEDQLEIYLKMVLPNGWCKNYDSAKHICLIYESRPDFCRVNCLGKLFDISNKNFDEFAINCCKQQIRSVYGGKSKIMKAFIREVLKKTNE